MTLSNSEVKKLESSKAYKACLTALIKEDRYLECDEAGRDVLFYLIKKGNCKEATHLMQKAQQDGKLDKLLDFDKEATNSQSNRTRVHQMVFYRRVDLLQYFVENFDIKFQEQINKAEDMHHLEAPIYSLVYNLKQQETIETLEFLLENGAHITSNSRNKFLHQLAANASSDVFDQFIEKIKEKLSTNDFEAILNAQDRNCTNNQEDQNVYRGRTPIFYAIFAENTANVKTLMKCGSSLKVTDEINKTPEFWLTCSPSTLVQFPKLTQRLLPKSEQLVANS